MKNAIEQAEQLMLDYQDTLERAIVDERDAEEALDVVWEEMRDSGDDRLYEVLESLLYDLGDKRSDIRAAKAGLEDAKFELLELTKCE